MKREIEPDTLKGELRENGFLIVPGLCEGGLMSRIRAVAERESARVRSELGDRDIGIGSAAGYHEIVQRSPGRWDVPISLEEFGLDRHAMPWWPLVAAALGEDAEDTYSGVVSSEPGSPAQFWHSDSPHIDADHRPPHAINVLIALHDIPLEMGPTECAAGSHVLTNHLQNPTLIIEQLIYQHAETTPETLVAGGRLPIPVNCVSPLTVGSALIFDDRLLHRGQANQSQATRHVAYFSYCAKGYTENTHFEAQRSVFE